MPHFLITGGTGLVGSHLVEKLLEHQENKIFILTRSDRTSKTKNLIYINWKKRDWENQVPDIDVVINLAGATLNQHWTASHKQHMMRSRIQSTHALYHLFKSRAQKPSVLFNASAMGYYPPSLTHAYTEQFKTLPHDFLSEIVYQWEKQADLFEMLGTRVIKGRFGLILSNQGGALPMMSLPYRYWVGGKIGHGKQWYSWIHLDDLVQSILFLIRQPDAKGVFNLNAPLPETQNDFGFILGKVLHRPHYTRMPSFILRLLLGEMSTLMLDTQYMVPERLQEMNFHFQYPELTDALQNIYKSSNSSVH